MVAPGVAMRRSRGLIVLAAVAASLFLGLASAADQDGVAGFAEATRAALPALDAATANDRHTLLASPT